MYLLDTDTIIYSLKGNEAVRQNLNKRVLESIKISAITLMELYYGAHKSQKVESNIAKIKAIENSLEVMAINPELSEIFGMLKSQLEKKGTPLDDFDLIIASTALTYNLTLVSNNERHFRRIDGLKLENWTVG
ncbi:MAG: type II toxin-antitoxin system VapC family toxin [Nitrospinae bacterium]|nr:type II toxin-antitoxin system VapC family toxin [Nitrospinota bacterium]